MIGIKQLGVATLYVLLSSIILNYFTNRGIVSAVWPGSGLALAVLLVGGKRYLLGVILGRLLINALSSSSPFWLVGATLASVSEVLLGVWLLTRNDKFSLSFTTVSDYLRLILLGGGVASIIGAIIGVLTLILSGFITTDYINNLMRWWMGDVLGVVLVTPLILTWWQTKLKKLTNKQRIETFLLTGITLIAAQTIFLDWFSDSLIIRPEAFILFLPIIWVAIKLDIRATTFVLNIVAIQALSGAYLKTGYFANDIATTALYNYWLYMLVLSAMGMTLATYVNQLNLSKLEFFNNNKHLNALIEAIPDAIFLKSADSRWLITNELAKQLFQLHDIPWQGKTEMELAELHPKFRAAHEKCLVDDTYTWKEGCLTLFTEHVVTENGQELEFEVRKVPIFDEQGLPQKLVILGRDMTERKQAEAELRIAAIAFESQEGMFITDANNVILRVNRAFTHITGYTLEDVIGKDPSHPQSGLPDTDFYHSIGANIQRTGHWNGEIISRRKTGAIYPAYLTITAVKNSDGIISNYVATLTDITVRKAAENEIERLAFYDPLTALPNRRLLLDRLKLALASSARSGLQGALLFIDLDNFKTLNDTLGHHIGDVLLQQVSKRLTACVRENDTVARLGGDEFVILLENLSQHALETATQTELIGEKMLASLNQPYQFPSYDYHSTASIGVTVFNDHEQSLEELLKQADIAMYQAKSAGRNAVRFFDPEMQASITARVALEADLRLALVNNQFQIYYQPQVYQNNQVIGAEVLIRWQHPQRGMVLPVNFIPLAEEIGLIIPIGQWVLETACAQIKTWENNPQTENLQLAVNVSAKQFHQVDFVEQVHRILNHYAIKPDRLKLELTESLVLDDINETIQKMNALRKIDVRFSMDDFGTGYSSLAYLSQLPLDQLKIDQSFIRNIGVKPADAVIVQTIIGMANNLGMEVIAEGVETEAQRTFLELHGCPFCQGYLFSRPVPIEPFELLLKSI